MSPSTLPRSDSGNADPRAYIQIADTVRRWIDDGTFKPGDKVTITSLAESYGVTRQTVARGLPVLVDEGRLKRFPGFGYAVQATLQHMDATGESESPRSARDRQQVLGLSQVAAPSD